MPSVVTVRSPVRFSVPSNTVHMFRVRNFWKVRVGSERRFLSFVFRNIGLPGFGLYPEKQNYEFCVQNPL